MNIILITLAILGFASVVLAIFVMSLGAYLRLKGDPETFGSSTPSHHYPRFMDRSSIDRRQGGIISFPCLVSGVLIPEDRRKIPDRRGVA